MVIGGDGALGGAVDAPGLGAGHDVEPAPLAQKLADDAAEGGEQDAGGAALPQGRVTASFRGLMSSMGMARFWVQATAFSEMNRMSPSCILSLAYWRTTSSILSALVIRWVFTGMR